MKLFLDTNVLIDFWGERRPFCFAAVTLMTFAEEGRCDVVLSSLSVINANFICCERANMPVAVWKRKMNVLKDFVRISSVNTDDIYASCDSEWKDYEDGVPYFSAKRNACDVIVTRNPKDFEFSDIKIMTLEQVVEMLNKN